MATVLITAGPTRENLDPVRFLSNHSTGKMGYALAAGMLERGHEVVLVSGPVDSAIISPELQNALEAGKLVIHEVVSAREMLAACLPHFPHIKVAIFAAAVADYRPETEEPEKIKKQHDVLQLRLVKNPDIALSFGQVKKPGQVSIGFALETEEMLRHGLEKMQKKNFDLVVMNSPKDAGSAFGFDTNKISIAGRDGKTSSFPLKSKREAARDIIAAIELLPAYLEA